MQIMQMCFKIIVSGGILRLFKAEHPQITK